MSAKLFPVKVCAQGTAEIESLPSYIHRLAYRHGVYVGELIRFAELQVSHNAEYNGSQHKLPRYIQNHEILRSNRLSKYLVDMFEYLTRQSLSGTYASFISHSFSRSSQEIVQGFRWCPECIGEMLELGEEPYFKLAWHFRAIKICPIHRTSLIQSCSYCGCNQTTYKKINDLGHCQNCGKPLSSRGEKTSSNHITYSWDDAGQDIIELIENIQENGKGQLSPGGLMDSVDNVFDYYWRLGREKEFYQLLNRDLLLSVVNHRKTLCLNDARKLSFRLGISLYDLISGNAMNTSLLLDIDNFCPFPKGFSNSVKREVRDHQAIFKRLKKILGESSAASMSLKATAKALGVSVGYLEYRFPAQSKEIVARYKHLKEEEYREKVHIAQRRSLEYFLSAAEGSAPKSRKQAYRLLKDETGLPKWILKNAIQKVYKALCFTR